MEEDDEAIQLAVASKEIHRLRSVVEELSQTIEDLKISQSRTPSTQGSSTRSQPRSFSKSEFDSPLGKNKTLFDVEEASSSGTGVKGEVLGGPMVGTPSGSPAYVNQQGLQLDYGPLLSPSSARQTSPDASYFQPVDPPAPRTARYISYPTPPPAAALEMYPHFLEHTPTTPYSFAMQQQLPPVAIPTCPPVPKYDETPQTFPLRHHSQPHLSTPYDYSMPTQPDPVSFKYHQHAHSLPTPLQPFPPSATAARFSTHPSFPPLSAFSSEQPPSPFEPAHPVNRPVEAEGDEEKAGKRRPLSLTTFGAVPKLRRTLSDSYLVSPLTPSYAVANSPGRNLAD